MSEPTCLTRGQGLTWVQLLREFSVLSGSTNKAEGFYCGIALENSTDQLRCPPPWRLTLYIIVYSKGLEQSCEKKICLISFNPMIPKWSTFGGPLSLICIPEHIWGCFFGKDFWTSEAEDQVNLASQSEAQDCSWVMTDPALVHAFIYPELIIVSKHGALGLTILLGVHENVLIYFKSDIKMCFQVKDDVSVSNISTSTFIPTVVKYDFLIYFR